MTALGLTPQQKKALDFIEGSIARGVSPSYEEIRIAIGLKSKSGVNRIVYALRERGHIAFIPNRSRSIALMSDRNLNLDAARYRWLRHRDLETIRRGGVFAGMTPKNVVLNLEDLDRAVDDAMAREASKRNADRQNENNLPIFKGTRP